ncbi:Protein of unknown function (DUF2421) domain containing protein [Tylopilus felleus]
MLQRELGIVAFAASGWAWSCLGIKLADIARSNKDPTASSTSIVSGQYIESAVSMHLDRFLKAYGSPAEFQPTVILAVFLFIGSYFFLYIKSRMPPGPVTFAYLSSSNRRWPRYHTDDGCFVSLPLLYGLSTNCIDDVISRYTQRTEGDKLTSVLEQMEPPWVHAFLKWTRLLDVDFQGDVLAVTVINLILFSLRNGNPLPQVTPCLLLNRFMERHHGLYIVHEESEEDFGLPKVLMEGMLESLQYVIFCVGVSTAFSIVTRLDKLMVAVKELVGEQYHINGVDIHVGDIVCLEFDEFIPADIVLISSSEPEGLCFIEASNLDGETNLKIKQASTSTADLILPSLIASLHGSLRSEQANNSLYAYEGTLELLSNAGGCADQEDRREAGQCISYSYLKFLLALSVGSTIGASINMWFLSSSQWCLIEPNTFSGRATKGLRTLCITYCDVSPAEHAQAAATINGRGEALD